MDDEARAWCIEASTPSFEQLGKGHLNPGEIAKEVIDDDDD